MIGKTPLPPQVHIPPVQNPDTALPPKTIWHSTATPGKSHYLGDHVAIALTAYGQKIFVDTRDIGLTPHVLVDGMWEPAVSEAFRRTVGPGMTVVDVGANIGWYSLLAASRVGEKGTVIAFEPNEDLVKLMRRSAEVNGFGSRMIAVEKGVMEKSCVLEFYKWANHQASSNFFWKTPSREQHDTAETIEVNCVSLDDYFRENPRSRVDVIKIDAEGSEPRVIAGADFTLHINPQVKIFMEFNPSYRDTIENLLRKGFRAAAIEENASLTFLNIEQILKRPMWSMLFFTR
jgi:FkbM family methyltransferase